MAEIQVNLLNFLRFTKIQVKVVEAHLEQIESGNINQITQEVESLTQKYQQEVDSIQQRGGPQVGRVRDRRYKVTTDKIKIFISHKLCSHIQERNQCTVFPLIEARNFYFLPLRPYIILNLKK